MNTISIGIEPVNLGYKYQNSQPEGRKVKGSPEEWYPYDDELLRTLGPLCRNLIDRYEIQPDYVIGHGDIATTTDRGLLGRKVDPGPLFPWESFHRAYGVGAWYDLTQPLKKVKLPNKEVRVAWIQAYLQEYGYVCPQTAQFDEGTKRAIQAFQMHFRPTNISGGLDDETIAILASLVDRYIR